YADLQRRRGNIEIAEAYTLPAAGIIDNLRKCCLPIRSADEVKHLRLRFLSGPSKMDLKEKVEEVHLHGNIAELEEDPAITARKLFLNIPGLIHLADDFVLKGYRNLDDLLKSKEAASWTSQQYREVKYFEHLKSRIATQEAVLFEMLLKDHLSEWNRDVVVSETGSVRRRELWARTQDVRFIVTHPSISSGESSAFFKEVVKHVLQTVNGASDWETWLEGAHSVMLKARIPQVFNRTTWRRLTLRWVPFDEWVPQLIDATGHSRFTEKLAGRMADK
ncbi:putative DNA polymerase beta-like, partial [Diplonema papillatum]